MDKTKVPEPVAQVVIRAFGLNELSAGKHTTKEGGYLEIDTLWIIEFPFYFGADIYVAGANQIEWIPQDDGALASNVYKGLLIAAPFTKFDFIGANPYRVIDLEWPDEITKSLQSLNMLPHWAYIPQADGEYQEYKVHTYWSGGGEGHASYLNITSQQPEITTFHHTILRTIKNMAAIYNDSEINQIIERGRNLLR